MTISRDEIKIIKTLSKYEDAVDVHKLAKDVNMNVDYVRYLIEKLRSEGYVAVTHKIDIFYQPGKKLIKFGTLPEIIIYNYIRSKGEIRLDELFSTLRNLALDKDDIKAGLGKLREMQVTRIFKKDDNNYVKIIGEVPKEIIKIINRLLNETKITKESLNSIDLAYLESLSKRPGIVQKIYVKTDVVSITNRAKNLISKLEIKEEKYGPVITILTPDIIKSGVWKEVEFKKYDVSIPGPPIYGGRKHPIRELLDEIREIWLSMGFIEEWGPLIELSFWNFDALFQPQDHPAREMHDTFYLKDPKYGELPSKDIVEKVKLTHENGWVTGSKGWRYRWDENIAKTLVLRTHTTSVTVRKVYEYGEKPVKIFAIGKVFRNETVDYKHLAEFYMVDGIVIDPQANLRQLFGVLKIFYKKLGFEKVLFWPSYFPYTEPSAQVCVYVDRLNGYLEMAGSGIFRPEVTMPLGVKWPVLAWGIGIERIFMVRYGLDDMRIIYKNDIGFLRRL